VACVATAWIITDGAWHDGAGYALLALIAVRLIWGWAGPPYARFANFVRGPRLVWLYAQMVLTHKEPRHIGHNPLGAG
jgi:cytochrome b